MRAMKNRRLHGGAQFALLVGLALGMVGFAAPALAQPGAPTGVTVTPGNGELTVSWTASTNVGTGILGHDVRWKLASDVSYISRDIDSPDSGSDRSYTILRLTNGETYDVQVRTFDNSVQYSPWTTAVQGTPAATVADMISDLRSTRVGPESGELLLFFTVPDTNGGSFVRYDVEYRPGTSGSWTRVERTPSNIFQIFIRNLVNGQSYQVRMRMVNSVGNAAWSNIVMGTPAGPPEAPPAPTLTPGDRQLTVAWQPPSNNGGRAILNYRVRWKRAEASDYPRVNNVTISDPTMRSHVIPNLRNTQAYDVQVVAANPSRGDWSAAAQATPVGPPDAPTALALTAGNEAIGVSWQAPANNGGQAITGYGVEWKLAGAAEADYSSSNVSISGTTASIAMLTSGASYDVRVRAVNSLGNGPWAAAAQGNTLSAPDAPRAPTLSSGASGVLSVSWSAPADGGTPITDYDVRWRAGSSGGYTELADTTDSTALSATITELEEGQEYQVQVRAQNSIGEGDWSPVATGSPSSAQRNARTTSRALSQAGGAVAAGAIDVLGGQLGAATGGAASGSAGGAGGNQSNFTIAGMNLTPDTKARTALPVRTHADEAAPKHNFALSDLLQLGAFRVSLFHKKDGDKAKKRRSRPATAGAPSKWAIWGRGNVRGFASETDAGLELDGNAYAGWLGVDYTHSRSLMGGLAVSYDESRTDYTDPEFGGGEVSTRLGSFYPYLRISPTEALDLWGLMGFGWGDLSFSGEGQEDTSTDMSLQVYALGAQLKLIDLYGARISLKSDASFAILETASQANLPGIRTEPSRMRFALAAQYPWQIDSVSRVTPSLELGGRLDFNEVSGGAGMELGGAVNYNHSTLRLNAEARARGLVYHNDPNVQDWGVSFQLRVDPNRFGQGLFASFAPHWGQSQSRVQRLWRDLDAPQGLAQDMSLQPHQMEAEFGYGFALPRMKATVSPFGRTRFAQTGAQTFSLGSRLQLGDMKLELTGEQQTAPLAPTDHRMSLHLSMPLGK